MYKSMFTQDDVSQQQSIPSPPIPTTVDDMDSDVFVRDSVTPPSPTLPPIDSAVRQKPNSGTNEHMDYLTDLTL